MSNDNNYAEGLFKKLKYRCNCQPEGFESPKEAHSWCENFGI